MSTEDKILHQKIFMGTKPNGRGIVKATAQLHQLGNQKPYFSITTGNGCQHDLILESMPHLKPLVDIHLSDEDGAPMHSVANAAYHLDKQDPEVLARHLRIPELEARTLISDFIWYEKDAFFARAILMKKIRTEWESIYQPSKLPKFGTNYPDYEKFVKQTAMRIPKFLRSERGKLLVGEHALEGIYKHMGLNKKGSGFIYTMGHSFGSGDWGFLRKYTEALEGVNEEVVAGIEKEVSSYQTANKYMQEIVDQCFRSYWKRQAEEAILMLQGEDEHLEITPEDGDPVFKVDGEKFIPESIHSDYGYLPYIECGDRQYYVALDSREAGEKAKEYWEDMAKNDKEEFACMVGEGNLVKWGMGEKAGPGSTKVYDMYDWFDLWLTTPEEQWASYDGKEVEVQINQEMYEQLGFTEIENDSITDDDGWIKVKAYRA